MSIVGPGDTEIPVDEVATDADVEELEKELEEAEQKAKRRTIAGLAFSAVSFVIGLLI